MSRSSSSGKRVIAVLVVLLVILHQDNWFWDDDSLVLGFLPIGLAWHMGISIAASLTWWLATRIAWPFDEEQAVDGGTPAGGRQ